MTVQTTTEKQDSRQSTALVEAPRRSVLIDMATRYGMEPAAFEQTLRNTVVPGSCTKEQFAAFLVVAREHDLNPLTKEIYAFPAKGGGITPIVGVDGWIKLANRRPEFDGIEFEERRDDAGKLLSVTSIIYRKDRSRPTRITEDMVECVRPTEPWKTAPSRMLRHKALIQGVRVAFGFAGIMDEDDAHVAAMRDVTPAPERPTREQFRRVENVESEQTLTQPYEAISADGEVQIFTIAADACTFVLGEFERRQDALQATFEHNAELLARFDEEKAADQAHAIRHDYARWQKAAGQKAETDASNAEPAKDETAKTDDQKVDPILPPLRTDGNWTAWRNDALQAVEAAPAEAMAQAEAELGKVAGIPNVVHSVLMKAIGAKKGKK